MVDVGAKAITARQATATGSMRVATTTIKQIQQEHNPKGSVIAVATVAAINAAKKTAELIPLCHNLALDKVEVDFAFDLDASLIVCTATVATQARTGVEMEALTAVHVGLLTVYDMCKAVDKEMEVVRIRLVDKQGGST